MSHRCKGFTLNKTPCKTKVESSGGYCARHKDQDVSQQQCICMVPDGDRCIYSCTVGKFCRFHQDSVLCIGSSDPKINCQNYVVGKQLCRECMLKRPDYYSGINQGSEKLREMLVKKHGPIIQKRGLPKTIHIVKPASEIVVPKSLCNACVLEPESCVICLEDFSESKKSSYRSLTCGHYFHMTCMEGLTSLACPMCRQDIKPNVLPKSVVRKIKQKEAGLAQEAIDEAHEMALQISEEINGQLLNGISHTFTEDTIYQLLTIFLLERLGSENPALIDEIIQDIIQHN